MMCDRIRFPGCCSVEETRHRLHKAAAAYDRMAIARESSLEFIHDLLNRGSVEHHVGFYAGTPASSMFFEK